MTFLSFKKSLLLCFMLLCCTAIAQIPDSTQTESQEDNVKYPILQIKGLFQARYLVGMSKDVDVNGLHHSDESGVSNNFMVKYMRVQVRAQISRL